MNILFNLTEAEIMANWTADEPVRVSVCCITYKQEQYIAQAIDSFLMQRTTFPFEIIIGEDCGGDSTLDMLVKYKYHYPNIIKVITSEHNIGANANLLRVFSAAQGEYIAVCEGDDYWCDEDKLQMQFEYMRNHSDCSFIVHPAYGVINSKIININWPCQNDQSTEFILSAKGQFSPTSAYFFRKDIVAFLPEWFSKAPVGDYYIEAIASSLGRCHCIYKYMSAYRLSAVNSWSELLKKDKTGLRVIDVYKKNIECLHELINSLPRYEESINNKISHAEYACALGYLDAKNYLSFKNHISNSNTIFWYDFSHQLLYFFREYKHIVFSFYYIRQMIKIVLKRN